jgi:hypothetical protein
MVDEDEPHMGTFVRLWIGPWRPFEKNVVNMKKDTFLFGILLIPSSVFSYIGLYMQLVTILL